MNSEQFPVNSWLCPPNSLLFPEMLVPHKASNWHGPAIAAGHFHGHGQLFTGNWELFTITAHYWQQSL
ncbi:hypothetical protein [Natronospira bacteriovora]|uniref:Uncharacterized protein n=1 Tax=Natronospira bacteriovora TaxID=3069753 RepID=A0ABU0W8N5_9GAMM|nr:hypothetical protein [Natronospira sp. AB-CW4]MDQ2070407.1 hypothetical protein [Natronospira sp. AB-CW4]